MLVYSYLKNAPTSNDILPAITQREAAAVNGPGPGPQTQHSHDKRPDELVRGFVHWTAVPLHPSVVYKALNMLHKGWTVNSINFYFYLFLLQHQRKCAKVHAHFAGVQ